MITIESRENKIYKETRKLKERKYRLKNKRYIIEGIRITEEAVKAGAAIEYLLFAESIVEHENMRNLLNNDYNKYIISNELFKNLSCTESSQGVIGVIDNSLRLSDKQGNFYVLADKVQDPGNLGTIIRTAHAADAKGVILTKGTVDVYNDKTIRSTMGSIFYMPIIEDSDLSFTKELIKNDYKMVVSALDAENDFFSENLSGNIIITVGNEGNGVSDEIKELSSVKVKIPMPGNAESLNVSVATGIMIYEKVRQNLLDCIEMK